MATKVFETVEIELQDGQVVTLKPLKIAFLREFMTEFNKIGDEEIASDNIKSIDLLFDCAAIAMRQYLPEMADKAVLEEALDLPTVYKIIEVASGIKLNDPNLLEAAGLVGTN